MCCSPEIVLFNYFKYFSEINYFNFFFKNGNIWVANSYQLNDVIIFRIFSEFFLQNIKETIKLAIQAGIIDKFNFYEYFVFLIAYSNKSKCSCNVWLSWKVSKSSWIGSRTRFSILKWIFLNFAYDRNYF